jgi:hypothetical protein
VEAERHRVSVPRGPAAGEDSGLLERHAPAFRIEEGDLEFNRIGTPRIRLRRGRERVDVDPERASLYVETRPDRIGRRDVLHLVYRIHFSALPWTRAVFYERHRNVGLMALVTLDAAILEPLLVTTVYTCGCYRALLPTELFPREALPEDWPRDEKRFYGVTLPALAPRARPGASRLVIGLASRTHRVVELRTAPEPLAGVPLRFAPRT